jgi:hypothetical protein
MIDVETYCGICGEHCCNGTDIEYGQRSVKLTIECPACAKRIEELENQIDELENDIEAIRG